MFWRLVPTAPAMAIKDRFQIEIAPTDGARAAI
jgi:hypothetical protein